MWIELSWRVIASAELGYIRWTYIAYSCVHCKFFLAFLSIPINSLLFKTYHNFSKVFCYKNQNNKPKVFQNNYKLPLETWRNDEKGRFSCWKPVWRIDRGSKITISNVVYSYLFTLETWFSFSWFIVPHFVNTANKKEKKSTFKTGCPEWWSWPHSSNIHV